MTEKELKATIAKCADIIADRVIYRLANAGKLKGSGYSESYRKTEATLKMYNHLPEKHPERERIDRALATLEGIDYKDIVASIYFDGMTIGELAEIYECNDATIAKRRNKLIRKLARVLYPEDVLREELQG